MHLVKQNAKFHTLCYMIGRIFYLGLSQVSLYLVLLDLTLVTLQDIR